MSVRWLSITLLAVLFVIFALVESPTRASLAATATSPKARLPVVRVPVPRDGDADSINYEDEVRLKTDPENIDSDCDLVPDGLEVVNPAAPKDTDSDGIIDALESRVLDSNGNGSSDEVDPSPGLQLSCRGFNPFAIQGNVVDRSRAEVRLIGGSNVTAVSIVVSTIDFALAVDSQPIYAGDRIALFDDGSHGDRFAGDGLWSRDNFYSFAELEPGMERRFASATLEVTDNGVVKSVSSYHDPSLGLVVVGENDVQELSSPAPGIQVTSNAANIINPPLFLEVQSTRIQAASNRFYEVFADNYDFVLIEPASNSGIVSVGGYYAGVKNDVRNIGLSNFDNSALYGSAGRLQGAIYLAFNYTTEPTVHEIMHRWAVYGLGGLGFSQCAPAHWGVAGSGQGMLGGFDPATLVNNGNGTFTTKIFGMGGNNTELTPLELYLAGFASGSQVPAAKVPKNVKCGSFKYNFPAQEVTFKADSISTVTIEQIKSHLGGNRAPNSLTSQKDFRTAWVIVSQQPLSDAEMAHFNNKARVLGGPSSNWSLVRMSFAEATSGLATMDTTITPPAAR